MYAPRQKSYVSWLCHSWTCRLFLIGNPNVQMVMFTMHTGEKLRKNAQAVGIKDVISKSDTIKDHLLASLRTICAARFPTSFSVANERGQHQATT